MRQTQGGMVDAACQRHIQNAGSRERGQRGNEVAGGPVPFWEFGRCKIKPRLDVLTTACLRCSSLALAGIFGGVLKNHDN